MQTKYAVALGAAALLLGAAQIKADDVTVYVGYADGLRGTGFFPSPWEGDPGVTFGGITGPGADAGAVRVDNNSGAPIAVDVAVAFPWNLNGGAVPNATPGPDGFTDLWGTQVIPSGGKFIVTETAHYNFDTSDVTALAPIGLPLADGDPTGAALIRVTVNGVPTDFLDTGHVLNTGGFDYATIGNESFNWRPVGTTGITNPGGNPNGTAPDAGSTAALFGIAVAGMAVLKKQA